MTRLMLSLCLVGFAVSVAMAEPRTNANIERDFDARQWKGTYELSSGHHGDIEINLKEKNSFYFTLSGEEKGYEYTGKTSKVSLDANNDVTIRSIISQVKGKGFDQTRPIDLPFEVILKGIWMMATPGPQEMIQGEIWFLDKTGKFTISKIIKGS